MPVRESVAPPRSAERSDSDRPWPASTKRSPRSPLSSAVQILCDMMMPVMTGMEVHAEISRLAPDQAQRVVMVTGGAFTAKASELLRCMPNRRLDKTFSPNQLRRFVAEMISSAGDRAHGSE